ncbi:DUF3322 domain-containing protein [Rugamonas sp.]|uniref:DUF3322 domain-containing protein n=1 Tax=Rugamonas sp. TaxID=1926287 RepID=UPI0025ECAD7C|nr:DUF3322 domain-containing protein [Rugamonas sp.]
MSAPAWTTPEQIRAQLQRRWDDGSLLAARLSGETVFPLSLSVRAPAAAALAAQFDEARRWIRALEEGARPAVGHGYEIVWRDINHRQLGRNRLPEKIILPSAEDALRLLGRLADARRFDALAAATLAAFPSLRAWLARRPVTLLEQAAAWPRILSILRWFVAHPRPGLYLRQLDIAGVDSKFIEMRKGLLAELLDQVLPADAIDANASGVRQFEARYGLLGKPALIRFRMLDPAAYIGGMSDLAVPVAQFASLFPNVRHVFITENEVNGLAFPDASDSMVIFGGGYAVERLADIAWLSDKDVIYWGDIDTHGFAILDRLRAALPHARTMLMDSLTLLEHRTLWGCEDADKRFVGTLQRLTDEEGRLFAMLRDNELGEYVRMEQERLGYTWVTQAITVSIEKS